MLSSRRLLLRVQYTLSSLLQYTCSSGHNYALRFLTTMASKSSRSWFSASISVMIGDRYGTSWKGLLANPSCHGQATNIVRLRVLILGKQLVG